MFAFCWLILAGLDPASWIIGIPAVLLATWASAQLAPPGRGGFKPRGILSFLPYFLWQSVRGGADVTARVLHPRMRVAPGFQSYRTQLSEPAARVFFLDCISLLPGTLTADLRQDLITLHAIDASLDLEPELVALERRVAELFGQRWAETSDG